MISGTRAAIMERMTSLTDPSVEIDTESFHRLLDAPVETPLLIFFGVFAALILISVALVVAVIVSILRSELGLGTKLLWVLFVLWVPVVAWFAWFLLGRQDARRQAEMLRQNRIGPAY